MWKIWPTKKQYLSWSLPSRISFISAYLGFVTLLASVISATFSYLNSLPNITEKTFTTKSSDGFFGTMILLNEHGKSKIVHNAEDGFINLIKEEDFDMDGNMDVLFSTSSGGNCCPPYFSILSARGDGYTKKYTHNEFWSWSDPEVLLSNSRWLFRVTQASQGVGNTSADEARVTFTIENGELIEIERLNKENRNQIEAIEELHSRYFTDNPDKENDTIEISYDLNNNKILDHIICSYWERWGTLNCSTYIDRKQSDINIGCQRIGVSKIIRDGYHALVCGRDDLLFFNKKTKSYEPDI